MSNLRPERTNSAWKTLGWSLYLACSWTWCIGMFLPVLLVRDYGVWGFVVFAAPNVVGAAAMGWVLADSAAAERILARHTPACRAFSGVTIAFHLFFLQWLGTKITGEWWIIALVVTPIAAAILMGRSQRVMLALAAAVWALSAAAFVSVTRDRAATGDWSLGGRGGPPVDLLWLAPVCAFGFALCPYLDPTFLRARRECGRGAARAAFTLGFGAFFLAMILLTLLYAPMFRGERFNMAFAGVATLGLLVGHVTTQAIFTCAAHWKESLPLGRGPLVALPLLGLALGLPFVHGWSIGPMPSHEVVYRCFMAFYGLVFPAYVWICAIPTPDGHSGLRGERGRRKLLVWSGAVGLAAPFFWMGFIQLSEFYLAPGLLIVLTARLAVRRG